MASRGVAARSPEALRFGVKGRFTAAVRTGVRGLALALLCYCAAVRAQDLPTTADRLHLIQDLSTILLGTQGTPLVLDAGQGWRGVVLAPPARRCPR